MIKDSQLESSQELTESQSRARILELDCEQFEDEMYDDSQLIFVGSVPEGRTREEMEDELNAAMDKENRDSWKMIPINVDDSPQRPVRITRPPDRYTPTPIPRPFAKYTKGISRPFKNPLTPPFTPSNLEDITVMETWLKFGVLKKKDDEQRWYEPLEDKLPWGWNFTEVEIRSKTFFRNLWTEEEWLSDQVRQSTLLLFFNGFDIDVTNR